jgi:hypothetical protein
LWLEESAGDGCHSLLRRSRLSTSLTNKF